ncbi:hypothetical protein CK203_019814 [Vitis vinifera]|uniref:Uncharacterized protein n=1 Tax=Vitis vinifera TaxID=29760 RepID=A0A438J3B2_VITVI|nr:hypothetical protein CK203_019814 [Vitis vinifera]
MEESEREKAGERESESDGGEQGNLCASEGVVSNVHSKSRKSLRKSSFGVESKTLRLRNWKEKGGSIHWCAMKTRGMLSSVWALWIWRRKGLVSLSQRKRSKRGLGFNGGDVSVLGVWSPETGCLMEGEKKSEAWVRIVAYPSFYGSGHP